MSLRRALARLICCLPAAALGLALVAAPGLGEDAGLAPVPAYVGYVNDLANVLSEPRRAALEGFLDQLQKKTGAQFALLTVQTTAPEDPRQYKVRVFQAWGIGQKGEDNGLLLLVAMKERQLRFETGYGLEGTLPDGWQSRVVRDLAVPRMRAGDYEDGITAVVLATAQRIANEKGVTLTWDGRELRYTGGGGKRLPPIVVAFIVFAFLIVFLSAIRSAGRGGGVRTGDVLGPIIFSMLSNRRRSRGDWWGGGFGGGGGGFGGGGSFGGFGGGSSGGGGGGGNW